MFDYLIVGAGLSGAVFAHEAVKKGKKCLVVEKRSHIGGNIYTEKTEGIHVHRYGAHIFHTNDREVWDYMNSFDVFNRYTNSPVANYKGEIYNLPFNMNTFNKMWGVVTPKEAEEKITEQRIQAVRKMAEAAGVSEEEFEPRNLEEQAIALAGTDIYEKLVKGYTEKQWGRPCNELPAFIIRRLPFRMTYDNNYFNSIYQGIPCSGYTKIIEEMLKGCEVRLNTDFLEYRDELGALADRIIYTGPIDAFFDHCFGSLEYRSISFETELLDQANFQGNAVVNYTDAETPFTRIIEHKWFVFGKDENGEDIPRTVISREYSCEWKMGDEPYYPVNDEANNSLYEKYRQLAEKDEKTIFAGRLGEYKYYDMDVIVRKSLDLAREICS